MLDKTDPKEVELISKMHEFNLKTGGISWSYVYRDGDGVATFVPMAKRPCYGEMRRYGPGSTRPDDYEPSDLTRPLKKGIREAVSVPFSLDTKEVSDGNAFMEFMFSEKSPWRRGIDTNGLEFTVDKNGKIRGVVLTETEVDPTVMVSLFMVSRYFTSGFLFEKYLRHRADGLSEYASLIAAVYTGGMKDEWNVAFNLGYVLPQRLSVERFVTGESADLSNNGTWRGQEDYNRPEVSEIFGSGDEPVFSVLLGEIAGLPYMRTGPISNENYSKILSFIQEKVAVYEGEHA